MNRVAKIALGTVLVLGQPAAVSYAQSADATPTQPKPPHDGNGPHFLGLHGENSIIAALAGLTALVAGVAVISNGHHHGGNGTQPVSP